MMASGKRRDIGRT